MTEPDYSGIPRRLKLILARIQECERRFAREPHSVRLLAISKTKSEQAILTALRAGQICFGENYVQESQQKIAALAEYPEIEWHFTGSIQKNKIGRIARLFSWVHTVDGLSVAEKLSLRRPENLPPLNVCIQVNIDDERSKSGMSAGSLSEAVDGIAELPRLRLRGLMAIPAPQSDFNLQREAFRRLRQLCETLPEKHGLDTLSMGMSADFEAAIAEGATIVRIGSAIFGPRGV